MKTMRLRKFRFIAILVAGASLACSVSRAPGTAIPVGRPADFEVQTATPTADSRVITANTPGNREAGAVVVLPLSDAPTHTPDPSRILVASPVISPTDTPILAALEPAEELTQTLELTQTAEITKVVTPAVPTRPKVNLDPPREGGDWDFEADYVPWGNPHGEPCPGAAVAAGWTSFAERGEFGSSCFNENLYRPNVFSGLKSQEITFDFISANSGVFRTIPTTVGHRYNIIAYAKHDRSLAPVQMYLGVDLTGGTVWNVDTVEWFPWDEAAEDTWVATEETVTATGEQMTIFIRGFHPLAEQGGKTVIDSVGVTDLGP